MSFTTYNRITIWSLTQKVFDKNPHLLMLKKIKWFLLNSQPVGDHRLMGSPHQDSPMRSPGNTGHSVISPTQATPEALAQDPLSLPETWTFLPLSVAWLGTWKPIFPHVLATEQQDSTYSGNLPYRGSNKARAGDWFHLLWWVHLHD